MGIFSGVRLVSAYKILYLDINVHYYMEFLARKQSAKVNKYLGSWEIYLWVGNVIGKECKSRVKKVYTMSAN